MDPPLRLHVSVRVVPLDKDCGAHDPRLLPFLLLEEFHFEPVPVGEAQVHPQEHFGPVLGLGPPGAGVDRKDRVPLVVLPGEHPVQLDPVELLRNLCDVGIDFLGEGRISRLVVQVEAGP